MIADKRQVRECGCVVENKAHVVKQAIGNTGKQRGADRAMTSSLYINYKHSDQINQSKVMLSTASLIARAENCSL